MKRPVYPFVAMLLLIVAAAGHAQEAHTPIFTYQDAEHPDLSTTGMVASQSRLSSEVGAAILAAGGNAIDAAIATGFSMVVTLPRAGNLGGGGFMLIHDASANQNVAIDYRERAPFGASVDMFLDSDGNVDNQLSRFSHLSAGVPGTVRGFELAHRKFGSLPWKALLEPAIRQARDGIVVGFDLAQVLASRRDRLCRDAAACKYYFKDGGVPYSAGEILVQSDLADTLQAIADRGADAFYTGTIADKIVAEMKRGGGLVDARSLAAYQPELRDALVGNYRGFEIVTMPPPSSGGVHLLQMLNIMEHFPVNEWGFGGADNLHLLAEVARLAYADRSRHLGDPDFFEVPVSWLTSKSYGKKLASGINMEKARLSSDVAPGTPAIYESPDTTHYSVVDVDGNVVANTYTLNFSYGSGIAVEGAGFLLNNEMDDFSAKAGVPNGYGLLGEEANAIAPGKRPLSSMTPTIVFAGDEPWFATGSPGGSRIITTVLQVIVNMIDHGMNLAEATSSFRVHHQWSPDELVLESGVSPDTLRILEERGHTLKASGWAMGSTHSVGITNGVFMGASDPRRPGAGAVAPKSLPKSSDN